jgi:hypothetical protein
MQQQTGNKMVFASLALPRIHMAAYEGERGPCDAPSSISRAISLQHTHKYMQWQLMAISFLWVCADRRLVALFCFARESTPPLLIHGSLSNMAIICGLLDSEHKTSLACMQQRQERLHTAHNLSSSLLVA